MLLFRKVTKSFNIAHNCYLQLQALFELAIFKMDNILN